MKDNEDDKNVGFKSIGKRINKIHLDQGPIGTLDTEYTDTGEPPSKAAESKNVPAEKHVDSSPRNKEKEEPPLLDRHSSSPNYLGWGVVAAVVLVVFFGLVSPSKKPPESRPYHPPAPAPAPSPSFTPYSAPAPTPAITATRVLFEDKPPVGRGHSLSMGQIRYCVYEKARIQAMENSLDSYNQHEVSLFNLYVDDYNSRCSSFRYRRGTLQSVQAELPDNRARLRREGISRLR